VGQSQQGEQDKDVSIRSTIVPCPMPIQPTNPVSCQSSQAMTVRSCTLFSPIRLSRRTSAPGAKPPSSQGLATLSSSLRMRQTCAGIGTGDAGSRNVDVLGITGTVDSSQLTVRTPAVIPLLGGFHDLTKLTLEVVDLVAQSCRILEAELDRCLVHLLLEALDQPPQVWRCQVEVLLAA